MTDWLLRVLALACLGAIGALPRAATGEDPLMAGFAKVDVTPQEPVRLSGYAARSTPMEGVDGPIYARAVAFRKGDGPPHVLVAVDSIGFSGVLVKEVFEALPPEIRADRSRFVMSATHSHTAPHVARGLTNLYTQPQSEEEIAATARYTNQLRDGAIAAAKAALADLKPARMYVGEGQAGFAVNRRVVLNKQWQGFGETPAGSVDHAVPVIRIADADTGKTRGLLFNYACHCTTFGPGHNRVNGDWAGYASTNLEAANPGAVALCTIGCGADANPHREGPMQLELAQQQGKELSDEVTRLAGSDLREITAAPFATFGYAGLPIDRPTVPELQERLKSGDPNVRVHAETMLATHERMGRLPETYPMPIQVWRFGDQFSMVFLGGEVVVDYAHRIKKDFLPGDKPADGKALTQAPLWVTAYANDVFGYVASERVRSEGGYETDSSMIYYSQPGRWSTGTEEVVMRRVHELFENKTTDRALSVNEALKTFHVPEGFSIDVVAAEPLIADPVNFIVAPNGKLWVVEMGDYPQGTDGQGKPGGRIRVLTDVNHDGQFDEAVIFLEDIAYPTGIWPWRDGAIISAAPEIIFAKDTDGDGKADYREVLFSGFKEANPQHRVNGFAYGLDGWLHLASGDTSQDILCVKTGEKINMAGRDIRIDPDSGRLETTSGQTQYGRVRDDWGNWFGNNNSEPLWQYVIDDGDLRRNPFVPSPRPLNHLTDPPAIPPVYPTSRTVDRFNDLWAANKYTSACSPLIVRNAALGADLNGAALVCEPVHNLVSRYLLDADGMSFKAKRHPSEQMSEFLSSTDGWFRPTRLMAAPDGSIWVADMYRRVIEHPEWIPEAWQAQVDVRSGHEQGRIYRLARTNVPRTPIRDFTKLTTGELVRALASEIGWERDTAQQLLVERKDPAAVGLVDRLLSKDTPAAVRTQAAWTRALLTPKDPGPLARFLKDPDPRVRQNVVRILGRAEPNDRKLRDALLAAPEDSDPRVRYELALCLGNWKDSKAGRTLAALAIKDFDDQWMRAAVLSSSRSFAEQVLGEVLQRVPESEVRTEMTSRLAATALGDAPEAGAARILALANAHKREAPDDWQFGALVACLEGLERNKLSLASLMESDKPECKQAAADSASLFRAARRIAANTEEPASRRCLAASILGRGTDHRTEDQQLLTSLLTPQHPLEVQTAGIAALAAVGDDSVPDLLLEPWKSMEPAAHSAVVNALLSRDTWTQRLLDAIAAQAIHAVELDASSRARLIDHPVAEIRQKAVELFQPAAGRKEVLAQYDPARTLKGDTERGAALFKKNCSACHRLNDVGNDVGARLAVLQNKSVDNLMIAILDPNQGVEGKYLNYVAATKDGRAFSGMIVEESATSITLARPDGKRDVLLRIDIEQLASSGKSFMPEGLEKELSPQDLADVMAFVQSATGGEAK
jgi:putative membrane-bound dehydrogenase-like protein